MVTITKKNQLAKIEILLHHLKLAKFWRDVVNTCFILEDKIKSQFNLIELGRNGTLFSDIAYSLEKYSSFLIIQKFFIEINEQLIKKTE